MIKNVVLIFIILLSYACSERSMKDVIIDKKRAYSVLTGVQPRSRRAGLSKWRFSGDELGPNEVKTKPWWWVGIHVIIGFSFTFKELRELHEYPGAWWEKPPNMDFNYMPNGGELQKRLLDGGQDQLALIDIMMYEAYHNPDRLPFELDDEILTLYWRYTQCIRKVDVYRNCPDPCNKPDRCQDVRHGNTLCRSYFDNSVKVDVSPIARDLWTPIFQHRYDCGCKEYFAWDRKTQTCVEFGDDCKDKVTKESPCYNGGTCRSTKNRGTVVCECMPAFTGETCQLPQDPCTGNTVCGRFPCRRDPANFRLGYTCLCDDIPGFYKFSTNMPRCVDIDECVRSPCTNGGTCNNTKGGYRCECPTGWVGRHCEHRNAKKPTWGEWASFSRCSVTCGEEGQQTASRRCSVTGRCVGTNTRSRQCRDVPKHCPKEEVFDDTFGMVRDRGRQNERPADDEIEPDEDYSQDYEGDYEDQTLEDRADEPEQYYNSPDEVEKLEKEEEERLQREEQGEGREEVSTGETESSTSPLAGRHILILVVGTFVILNHI